jgi:D-methionine transport system ATP-binding protein
VLITHEMSVIHAIADRVVVPEAGRVIEQGPVWRVFVAPQAAGTRRLLQALRPELPESLAVRLRPGAGPDATLVLRVEVHGAQARAPLLVQLGEAVRRTPALLHGGIDHVGAEPVGTLFIGLDRADGETAARAAAFLRPRVTNFEVLGHVADD